MTFWQQLGRNDVLLSAITAWFIAQILKGLFFWIVSREVDFTRFLGPGGFPSSHSAFVTALAAAVAFKNGAESTEFALAVVFAMIVMYDAAGIRRAAGKQAQVLNIIVDELFHGKPIREHRLKELLGHTPIEVLAGAILGIVTAYLISL